MKAAAASSSNDAPVDWGGESEEEVVEVETSEESANDEPVGLPDGKAKVLASGRAGPASMLSMPSRRAMSRIEPTVA